MRSQHPNLFTCRGILDTLAQTGTAKTTRQVISPTIIVKGNGSEVENKKRQLSRAKRKMISQKLMLCLIDVAISKKEPERIQIYWNTYHCQNDVIQSGGRIYGDYCKNRFCTVCSGIRKAEIINKYLPVIQTWPDPHFVTLTAKAVPAKSLKRRISDMLRGFRILTERYKKQDQRGKGYKIIGIKSLECNFNPKAKTYNPHLHLIVATEDMANMIVSDWLKLCTKNFSEPYFKFANRKGQYVRPVEDRERDLIEIVKYGAKVFTDPTMKKKSQGTTPKEKVTPYIYASAMDNIIVAMSGHRVFDRFGFDLPKMGTDTPRGKSTTLNDYTALKYNSHLFDWIDSETERALSGYVPSSILRAILDNNIDKELE